MVKVVFDLHVAALLALARCDGCLDAYLMAQRAEEYISFIGKSGWSCVYRLFLFVGRGKKKNSKGQPKKKHG